MESGTLIARLRLEPSNHPRLSFDKVLFETNLLGTDLTDSSKTYIRLFNEGKFTK